MPLIRSEPESEDSPVQNAVVRVFDRIVDANNPGLEPAQVFVGRMLLRPPQARRLHCCSSRSHLCYTASYTDSRCSA